MLGLIKKINNGQTDKIYIFCENRSCENIFKKKYNMTPVQYRNDQKK